MSSDTGYIIRQNRHGKFALQSFFYSDDELPPVSEDATESLIFNTFAEAVEYYNTHGEELQSEYGLTINLGENIKKPTIRVKENQVKTKKYVRKPFEVDAVQVTEENIFDVAKWAGGSIVSDSVEASGKGTLHIKIQVKNAINEKQTQAFPGDWVLSSRKGFKIYTDRAFKSYFEEDKNVADETTAESFDESYRRTLDNLGFKGTPGGQVSEGTHHHSLPSVQDAIEDDIVVKNLWNMSIMRPETIEALQAVMEKDQIGGKR